MQSAVNWSLLERYVSSSENINIRGLWTSYTYISIWYTVKSLILYLSINRDYIPFMLDGVGGDTISISW